MCSAFDATLLHNGSCSVDFNTLEQDKAGRGRQQQLGSLATPADRLVACVNDFFELFVS